MCRWRGGGSATMAPVFLVVVVVLGCGSSGDVLSSSHVKNGTR